MSYATRALAVASALLMGAPTAVLAHTNSIGYVGGGNGASRSSGIDKIAFPADTKTTLSATLTTAREGNTGFADCGVF